MLKVKGSKGLLVREGRALTSPERATLACGELVHVVETRATVLGDARCRLASGGWCSRKLLEPAEDAEINGLVALAQSVATRLSRERSAQTTSLLRFLSHEMRLAAPRNHRNEVRHRRRINSEGLRSYVPLVAAP